ncbi:hypothetical protein PHLCEN_2v3731 [Hermanssonia centrifuga]|uniref:Uncharacterized protein n=1 Tax=Hermanssonia centrifuga TaxID=98765 RepID=A0A2R6QBR9_9APHY|nr:hypothetical protein PHLCEN_2v3731 [Hermanssonia centrifuga]
MGVNKERPADVWMVGSKGPCKGLLRLPSRIRQSKVSRGYVEMEENSEDDDEDDDRFRVWESLDFCMLNKLESSRGTGVRSRSLFAMRKDHAPIKTPPTPPTPPPLFLRFTYLLKKV